MNKYYKFLTSINYTIISLILIITFGSCDKSNDNKNISNNQKNEQSFLDTLKCCNKLSWAFLYKPSEIGYLSLDLRNEEILNIDTLKIFSNLKSLTIYGDHNNKFTMQLFNAIKELSKLETLSIYFLSIDTIPKEIILLTNLEILDFNDNQIESIPNYLFQLRKLKHLSITKNKIKFIPKSIGQLSNLTDLDISKNHIIKLPSSIGKLTNLEIINLNRNELKDIPKELGYLPKLSEINLRNNSSMINLKSIFKKLQYLQSDFTLEVGNDYIKNIPDEIGLLKNMIEFELTYIFRDYQIKETKNISSSFNKSILFRY